MIHKRSAARVAELLATLSLEEKVAQLVGYMPTALSGRGDAADLDTLREAMPHGIGAVSAIMEMGVADPDATARKIEVIQRYLIEETSAGIPALVHAEALNGFVYAGALQFPTPIGMASTFRPEHAHTAAAVAARQMSALGIRHAFSPVLDVARDARFGRVHETYGEDPHLCAAFGVQAVRGLQESGHGVIATGKHFLGYAASEAALNMANVNLGNRELRETYAVPFEAASRDADLAAVMNSYSCIDGVPVAVSRDLLTGLLREELGFQGVVVSDYGSVEMVRTLHGVGTDLTEAAIRSLEAGIDVELPTMVAFATLVEAGGAGILGEDVLDRAVERVLFAKARAGLLEGTWEGPRVAKYRATSDEIGRSQQIAADSLVLLRNEGGVLPLAPTTGRIAVVGPFADRLRPFFAAYSGPAGMELIKYSATGAGGTMAGVSEHDDDAGGVGDVGDAMASRIRLVADSEIEAAIRQLHPDARSIAEALGELAPHEVVVEVSRGADHLEPDASSIPEAVAAAERADVTVCVVGEKTGWVGDATAGEGRDRASLHLLGGQRQLLEAVAATGTPVVVVLLCGRPLDIGWMQDVAGAILLAWHPATYGGHAVASALWGDVNPGGKLPVTFPRSVGHLPMYAGHRLGSGYGRPDGGRAHGHIDQAAAPTYPFGHGLSYTDFAIDSLRLAEPAVPVGGTITATVSVTNVGRCCGDEVVQFYGHDMAASVTRPVRQLVGFRRVTLEPGENSRLTLTLDSRVFALWDIDDRWRVEPGTIELAVARSSGDVCEARKLELTGSSIVLDGHSTFLGAVQTERTSAP